MVDIHHNSDLDSWSSSSGELSVIGSCDCLGGVTGSWGSTSPETFAVNCLASKSRSCHSGTILLAPWENDKEQTEMERERSDDGGGTVI